MDPNKVLDILRQLVVDIYDDSDFTSDKSVDLADAFTALDEWLNKGGFLPAAWKGAK